VQIFYAVHVNSLIIELAVTATSYKMATSLACICYNCEFLACMWSSSLEKRSGDSEQSWELAGCFAAL